MRALLRSVRIAPLAIATLAVVCATLVASARETPARAADAAPQPAWSAVPRSLPATIAQALIESGRRVVTVVAADIDDDGDLDVVASDGSLDLLVWTNDGAGHLTRRRPVRPTGWRDDPAGPTLTGRNGASHFFTHDDLPSVRDDASAGRDTVAARGLTDAAEAFVRMSERSTRSPRAPPAVSLLS